MEPSSSNTGFFQRLPVLENQFHDDVSFQRIAKLFVPASILDKVGPEIEQLGQEVLSQQIFDWITDAEKNQPYLRGSGRDAFGRPKSELVVTEGWRKLQDFGLARGFVAYNYDTNCGPYNRVVQFLRCHLWEASCANTLCPAAMQDGAARLLQRHLSRQGGLTDIERQVLQNAYNHLISRDPANAWTSGQWMTERTGGSDVSQTETVAVYDPYPDSATAPLASAAEKTPLGPWSISGFKWFSSATDSQMTILLARTKPGLGVSAFFAPMRRHNPSLVSITGQKDGGTELNGITIQRLKAKFGTQSLPTAELELKGMRGWMIGEEGKGIQGISTILNITRVHSSVSSMGYLGRSIAVAKAYALVREIGVGKGKRTPLSQHPLHMRTLVNTTVDYHGMMLLDFYTLYILGLDEHLSRPYQASDAAAASATVALSPPPKHFISPLLRVLSSLHKAYICEATIPLVFGCMESLGGVGYLVNSESEYINLARIFRDACVGAIWEGTTDLLSSDTLRALKHSVAGKESLSAMDWFVSDGLKLASSGSVGEKIQSAWDKLRERLEKESQGNLLPEARHITFRIAEVLMAVLYLVDAKVNPGREIDAMCNMYLSKRGFVEVQTGKGGNSFELDLAIVYGSKGVGEKMAKL
ncbi:Acyl-CoA dehydrogenase/oxidase, N-terminal and middle domain containing protein [Rhypophila sp. PSN 637]